MINLTILTPHKSDETYSYGLGQVSRRIDDNTEVFYSISSFSRYIADLLLVEKYFVEHERKLNDKSN